MKQFFFLQKQVLCFGRESYSVIIVLFMATSLKDLTTLYYAAGVVIGQMQASIWVSEEKVWLGFFSHLWMSYCLNRIAQVYWCCCLKYNVQFVIVLQIQSSMLYVTLIVRIAWRHSKADDWCMCHRVKSAV